KIGSRAPSAESTRKTWRASTRRRPPRQAGGRLWRRVGVRASPPPPPGARPVTVGARLGALVAHQVLAHRDRVGLLEAALEVGQDAFERMPALDLAGLALGALGLVDELDLLA